MSVVLGGTRQRRIRYSKIGPIIYKSLPNTEEIKENLNQVVSFGFIHIGQFKKGTLIREGVGITVNELFLFYNLVIKMFITNNIKKLFENKNLH